MSKNFWKFIISFWAAIIIAGGCTYLYIQYENKQERKQFIAKFQYEEITDEDSPKLENYKSVTHNGDEFLHTIEKSISTIVKYEKKTTQFVANESQDDAALAYIIDAYQSTKKEVNKYANVEIENTSLVTRKKYETISLDTYNYLQAASVYFIISAKKLSSSSPQIEEQYVYAQSTMHDYYKELQKNIQAVESKN